MVGDSIGPGDKHWSEFFVVNFGNSLGALTFVISAVEHLVDFLGSCFSRSLVLCEGQRSSHILPAVPPGI